MSDENMRKIELWLVRNHSYNLAVKANDIHNRILGKRHGLIIGGKTPFIGVIFKCAGEVISYMRENGLDEMAREYGEIALFIASSFEEWISTPLNID